MHPFVLFPGLWFESFILEAAEFLNERNLQLSDIKFIILAYIYNNEPFT